jgi:hypothetical protein
MKTILVIYTNSKLESKKDIAKNKRYSFNTESDVKEGDLIKTQEYSTNLQVVKVLPEAFKYYNASTGELSNEFKSTLDWEIRRLEIREEDEEIIFGVKL